jgi:hypothetical protein
MITLRIEHAITDLGTWGEAFARFDDARRSAGVRAHRVHRPVDDPCRVVVDLDFDTAEEAAAFRDFLRTAVWAVPENSPALAGTPTTVLLELAAL